MPSLTAVDLAFWLTPWHGQIATFVLILFRMSGLLAVGPLFGRAVLPWQARVGLAISLSLMLAPLTTAPSLVLRDVLSFVPAALCEIGLGFLLGCSSLLIFWAIPFAGHLLDQQHGTPVDDEDVVWSGSPQTRWLTLWGATCFLICSPINGHLQIVASLAEGFQTWPLAETTGLLDSNFAAELLSHACQLSLLVLAPALATMLLMNVGLGLLSASGLAATSGVIGNSIRPFVAVVIVLASLSGMNQFIADVVRSAWLPPNVPPSPTSNHNS